MTGLPSEWVTRRLGDLALITMGQSPPGSTYNKSGNGTPFFQGKSEFGAKHPTVRQWTTGGTKFAEPGDVLMSVRAPVGPTNIADTFCSIGRGLASIRSGESLDQQYLIWYLKYMEAAIQARGKGTTFDAISGNDLRDTLVSIPGLTEQRRIVAVLDGHLSRLDKVLASIDVAKRMLETVAPSAFQSLISRSSSGSKTIPFKEFVTLQRGYDLPKQDRKLGSVPIVGSNGVLGFHQEAKVRGPGVATGRSGTIGRVHFIAEDYWPLNTALYVKDFKGNHPLFVYEFLQTLDLKHFAGGSTVPSLDRNVLSDIQVELPELEHQVAISLAMETYRELVVQLESRLGILEAQCHLLRRSILHLLLGGIVKRNESM